jgi:hypothetical protein
MQWLCGVLMACMTQFIRMTSNKTTEGKKVVIGRNGLYIKKKIVEDVEACRTGYLM